RHSTASSTRAHTRPTWPLPSNPTAAMSTLHALENHDEFHARHIGPNAAEVDEMLAVVGAPSLDGLVDAIVPASIKLTAPLNLPAVVTEEEALAQTHRLSDLYTVCLS